MKTVAALIEELQKFPPEAHAYAYEGEITGVVICAAVASAQSHGRFFKEQLGWVPAYNSEEDDGAAHFGYC